MIHLKKKKNEHLEIDLGEILVLRKPVKIRGSPKKFFAYDCTSENIISTVILVTQYFSQSPSGFHPDVHRKVISLQNWIQLKKSFDNSCFGWMDFRMGKALLSF